MAVTLGLNLFGRDLKIFRTTFESGISSPRLKKEIKKYHLIWNGRKKSYDFQAS